MSVNSAWMHSGKGKDHGQEAARSGANHPEAEGVEVELARGRKVPKVCRKLGVTEQTYRRGRKKYGGLRMDQAKRRRAVEAARDTLGCEVVSARRACKVLEQSRSTQRRKAYVAGDEPR